MQGTWGAERRPPSPCPPQAIAATLFPLSIGAGFLYTMRTGRHALTDATATLSGEGGARGGSDSRGAGAGRKLTRSLPAAAAGSAPPEAQPLPARAYTLRLR